MGANESLLEGLATGENSSVQGWRGENVLSAGKPGSPTQTLDPMEQKLSFTRGSAENCHPYPFPRHSCKRPTAAGRCIE